MANHTFAELEAEYCPPIDPALLAAILSDFDLSSEQGVQDARSTLGPLKESALLEEQIGFDASGTGGAHITALEDERPATSVGSLSRETDLTSLSNGVSSLDLEHSTGSPEGIIEGAEDSEELEKLDEETKIRLLTDVFGKHVTGYGIKHTLRKCNGRWHAAMEELLNHVYFDAAGQSGDESKVPAKGIEAFAEDNVVGRGRRKKIRDRRARGFENSRSSLTTVSSAMDGAPTENRWNTAGQDIDFIVKRTGLSQAVVSSTYYQNGANLPKTIGALLKNVLKQASADNVDGDRVATNAHELGADFPTISPEYLTALIRLTYPSTASAHELAKSMTMPAREAQVGGLQIITNYQPPTGVETTDLVRADKPSRHAGVAVESSFSSDVDASSRAKAYATARNMAFAQAQAAHRRAKSDRLMGGAAAYYGQVSRDLATLSVQASAAAADEVAHAQSSASQVDLHGIDVLNAVRIAQRNVESWWQRLGENQINGRHGAEDRQTGYRIIVGLGRHSEGGKSKIGPAVRKMLREQGWRIEDEGAAILVKGRPKR